MSFEDYNMPTINPETKNEGNEACFSFENLKVTFDKATQEILNRETIESALKIITQQIDETLGQERSEEQIDIYSFSDRMDYTNFLKENFPDRFEHYDRDNAVFYQSQDKTEKIIVNHTPVIRHFSDQDLKEIEKMGMSAEDVINIARSNIFSSIAHELTHLHPFFGGVGNDAAATKWEQESVCIFIGEKTRAQYGNSKFKQDCFKKAQEEMQKEATIDLEKIGADWNHTTAYEEFFYPYLEKQYGLNKLQILWQMLSKEPKKTLSEATEYVYRKNINVIEEEFRSAILSSENYEEIKNK